MLSKTKKLRVTTTTGTVFFGNYQNIKGTLEFIFQSGIDIQISSVYYHFDNIDCTALFNEAKNVLKW